MIKFNQKKNDMSFAFHCVITLSSLKQVQSGMGLGDKFSQLRVRRRLLLLGC